MPQQENRKKIEWFQDKDKKYFKKSLFDEDALNVTGSWFRLNRKQEKEGKITSSQLRRYYGENKASPRQASGY